MSINVTPESSLHTTPIIASRTKSATEVVSYVLDWDTLDFLGSDTISSSSWSVSPTGLTIDSDSNTTTTATVVVSGGTAQTAYTLTNQIVTAGGQTRERAILVHVGVGTPTAEGEDFTYDLSTNIGAVRFWLRDTEPTKALFSDTEIQFRLTANASETSAVNSSVIELLVLKIAEFENPEYVADWLEEREMLDAAKVLKMRLQELRKQFGISQITASVGRIYRADSLQTAEPDYSDGADDASFSQVTT